MKTDEHVQEGILRPGHTADKQTCQACEDRICTCYCDCRKDSHSGRWHQHESEPCPVHPGAPMVG